MLVEHVVVRRGVAAAEDVQQVTATGMHLGKGRQVVHIAFQYHLHTPPQCMHPTRITFLV
jgi:hypothetical protein